MLSGNQVAVDEIGVGFGQRREDDNDQVDVSGDWLELAARVGSAEFGLARQLRDDDADALVTWPPDHSIAGHQCWQVCPQVAAEDLTTVLAFLSLDFDLHAEVGDDQAGLFRAEIAALEFLHCARFTARRASGALFLDLLDAPALPAVELAFGHLRTVPRYEKTASLTCP